MPTQGQLFSGKSIPHNLVSRKVTFAKQVCISSLSLLLRIIKWPQRPCPGQMQILVASRREGYVTTTVYGAPWRVITFTFSPPREWHCQKSASEIPWIVSHPRSFWTSWRKCRLISFWKRPVAPGCIGRGALERFCPLRRFNQLRRLSHTDVVNWFHNWPWVKSFQCWWLKLASVSPSGNGKDTSKSKGLPSLFV